jgi:hypothetical protein
VLNKNISYKYCVPLVDVGAITFQFLPKQPLANEWLLKPSVPFRLQPQAGGVCITRGHGKWGEGSSLDNG